MRDNKEFEWSRRRATAGFTLMEVLMAIALMVILMGVAFVAVQDYQRSVKQTELNAIAREIFISAQNHLTAAESQGTIDELYDEAHPIVDGDSNDIMGLVKKNESGHTYYYWFVSKDDKPENHAPSTLIEMLPYGAIDEVVRTRGSYVIQYDIEPATIINVFYSDQSSLSQVSFKEGDYNDLFSNYVGEDKNVARHEGLNKNVIGWYGGDDLKGVKADSSREIVVAPINAERLEVKVSLRGNQTITDGATLKLFVYGNTSKKTRLVNGPYGENVKAIMGSFADNGSRSYLLDDITSNEKEHFAELFCAEDDDLIPGEDITVYAIIDSATELIEVARSNSVHTNSLFDRMETDRDGRRRIIISNIRHLENLDTSISGYLNTDAYGSLGSDASSSAKQIADLRWSGNNSFTKRIGGNESESVQIYSVANPTNPTNSGTFSPVTPAVLGDNDSKEPFDYDGDRHGIYKVKVNTSGPAGIFADLPVDGSSIEHLELVDCDITSTKSSAGTLLAAVSGNDLTLTDILAHDYDDKQLSKVNITSTASGESIGGLIGSITGNGADGVAVDGCAASVYLKSESANSYAGGLIGHASGKVKVSDSYVGGHTNHADGKIYDKDNANVSASEESGCAAGGFIGYMSGGSIEYCYTTASVAGNSIAGGFIGECEGGTTISDTYATGLVVGGTGESAKTGAFFGKADGVVLSKKNQYYSIINDGMGAVGEGDSDKITAFDESIGKFNEFYLGNNGNGTLEHDSAKPYDSVLRSRYGEKYPLLSIRQLNTGKADALKDFFIETHYGDYPDPITYVINEPRQSGSEPSAGE